MASPTAAPAVVKALADPDQENREIAVATLEAGLPPAVGYPQYRADWSRADNLQRRVDWWRSWWEREGKAKYGKGEGK